MDKNHHQTQNSNVFVKILTQNQVNIHNKKDKISPNSNIIFLNHININNNIKYYLF